MLQPPTSSEVRLGTVGEQTQSIKRKHFIDNLACPIRSRLTRVHHAPITVYGGPCVINAPLPGPETHRKDKIHIQLPSSGPADAFSLGESPSTP
ncbi:hypothetical protein TNCT_154371 [Trichonephila clavata]|uniref:Uncharacterized protein n=1 Tax=Trichonephila clavata TaxID=2740835 RepID=A0A8X6LEB7_TRICU|nr:hypothetical protein TNCT_154371 [Trichonephila clavata]